MNYFVIGFSDKKGSQGHQVLYAGTSRSEAHAAVKAGGAGVEIAQLFASPVPSLTVRHGERSRRRAERETQAPLEPQATDETVAPNDSDLAPQGEESSPPTDDAPEANTGAVEVPAEPATPLPLPLPEKKGKR